MSEPTPGATPEDEAGLENSAPPLSLEDAFSAAFEEASTASSDSAEGTGKTNLLAQCNVTSNERQRNISARLNVLEDPAALSGLNIVKATNTNDLDPVQFVAELRAAGQTDLAEALEKEAAHGGLNRQSILITMATAIDSLSGVGVNNKDIFPTLPFDQKTPEEGERRKVGEETLVAAKTALLVASMQEIGNRNFAQGGAFLDRARIAGYEYPAWFVESLEKALRGMDLAQMGETQLDQLRALSELALKFPNSWPDSNEASILSVDPNSLDGLKYAYRKCKDAAKRVQEIEAEIQKRETISKHETDYAAYATAAFTDQADGVQKFAADNLKSGRGAFPQAIFLNVGSNQLMDTITNNIRAVRELYFNSYSRESIKGILEVLQVISSDKTLAEITQGMLTRGSALYTYNDGTMSELGDFSRIEPEKAREAAKIKVERLVFASAFGLIKAHIDYEPPFPLQDFVNQEKLETMIAALKIVGKGQAATLMIGKDPSFTPDENQAHFRREVMAYHHKLSTDSPEKAKFFLKCLAEGAKQADSAIKEAQAKQQETNQKAVESLMALETDIRNAEQALEVIPEIQALIDQSREIPYIDTEELARMLTVIGDKETRKITISTDKVDALNQQLTQLKEQLTSTPDTDTATKNSLHTQIGKINAQLIGFAELSSEVAKLGSYRFVVEKKGFIGLGSGSFAAYHGENLSQNFTDPTIFRQRRRELQLSPILATDDKQNVIDRAARLREQFKEIQAKSPVGQENTIATLTREAQAIQAALATLKTQAEAVVRLGASLGAKDAFAQTGSLAMLSKREKSPFSNIIQYKPR